MMSMYEIEEYYRATGGKIKIEEYNRVIKSLEEFGIDRENILKFITNNLLDDGDSRYVLGIIEDDGKVFYSVKECIEKYLKSTSNFRKLLESGMDFREAIENDRVRKQIIGNIGPINWHGETYESAEEIASEYGYLLDTLQRKLAYSSNLSVVLTKEIRNGFITFNPRNGYAIVLDDKRKYSSLKSACKQLGLNYKCILARVKNGIPVNIALNDSKGKEFKVECVNAEIGCRGYKNSAGMEFASVKDALEYHRIPEDVYKARRNENWSMKEAIEIPVKALALEGKPIVVCGVLYESLENFCKKHGISYENVLSNIKDTKMNVLQALVIEAKRSRRSLYGHTI